MALFGDAPRRARRYAESTGEDVLEQIETALGQLSHLSDSFGKRGRSQLSRAQHLASGAADQAEDTIRGNLVASLIVALGLGVMIGFLLPRR